MLTRVKQIAPRCKQRFVILHGRCCMDYQWLNPDHMPKTGSIWPTLRVKIARGKKWAWIGICWEPELLLCRAWRPVMPSIDVLSLLQLITHQSSSVASVLQKRGSVFTLYVLCWFLLSNLYILTFTQRRSVAKNTGCFRRNLFVCGWVCGFVCQHDNFSMTKHRMIKLGGRCIVQKSRPSLNLGVIAPAGSATPQMCLKSAESRRMTQNVNKAMWAGETSHRTHRTHSTCYDVGKISTGCLVSYIFNNIVFLPLPQLERSWR